MCDCIDNTPSHVKKARKEETITFVSFVFVSGFLAVSITYGVVSTSTTDAAPTAPAAAADTASPAFATNITVTVTRVFFSFIPIITRILSLSLIFQRHLHQPEHEHEFRNEHNREHPQGRRYGSELQREFFRRPSSTVVQPGPPIGICPVRTHVEEYLGTINNPASYEYNHHRQLKEYGGAHNRATATATATATTMSMTTDIADPHRNSVNSVDGFKNTNMNRDNINNTNDHNENPDNEIMFLNGTAFEILSESKRTSVCSTTSATIATATATTISLARPTAINTLNRTQRPSRLETHIQDQSMHSLDTLSSHTHIMGTMTAKTSSTACTHECDLDAPSRGTVGKDGQDSLERMGAEEEEKESFNVLDTTVTTDLDIVETIDVSADTDARLADITAAAINATGFTDGHLQQRSSDANDIVFLYDIACKYTESFDSATRAATLSAQNTTDEGAEPQGGVVGTPHDSYADADHASSSSSPLSLSLAVKAAPTRGGEDDGESKEKDGDINIDMSMDEDEIATHGNDKEKAKDDNEDETMILIPLNNKPTNKNTSSLSSTPSISSEKTKGMLVVTHWRKPPELQERLQGVITLQELMDYALCTDTAAAMALASSTPAFAPAPVHVTTSQSTAATTGGESNDIEETFSGVKIVPTDTVNAELTRSESLNGLARTITKFPLPPNSRKTV
ncbi:hypothetical protein BG011_005348 [Mortierella polycephala]|uniref:Uncharacterized protein n=1 Tax=Mortierella polycephala TaxID=41804 RepID=A0A9P6PYC4_9FUNG|nr:hypothetical protein BG011_005348 [Mortierella polycephala]